MNIVEPCFEYYSLNSWVMYLFQNTIMRWWEPFKLVNITPKSWTLGRYASVETGWLKIVSGTKYTNFPPYTTEKPLKSLTSNSCNFVIDISTFKYCICINAFKVCSCSLSLQSTKMCKFNTHEQTLSMKKWRTKWQICQL